VALEQAFDAHRKKGEFAGLKAEHVDHEDFATRALRHRLPRRLRRELLQRRPAAFAFRLYVSPIELELRSQTGAIAA
jgi:hypothetical protein